MRWAYLRATRAEHAERGGDGVAAALDGELDDALGIEVVGVLGERRAGGVLDALVDGEDRDVAPCRPGGRARRALERAQHRRRAVASREHAVDEVGAGQVEAVARDRRALVAEEVLRLLAEDRFDAADAASGARDGHGSQATFTHGLVRAIETPRLARPARAGEDVVDGIEGLGSFYLGKPYDADTKALNGRLRPLRLEGPDDARRLRRHDRHRGKTGLCLGVHRRGRDRRHPGDRHRSQGRPRQPAADVPGAAAGGLPAVDQRGRRAPRPARRRTTTRSSRPSSGARAWPTGARTARASSGCGTRPTSRSTRPAATPGCRVSVLGSFAPPGRPLGRRGAPRPDRRDRDGPARRCSASTPTRSRAASTSCSRASSAPPGRTGRRSTSPR